MDARIDFLGNPMALKFVKHINSAGAVLHNSALPAATQELVKLRASQINGCGCCTDMHTKDARHTGESQQRLNLVAAWREATVFTDAERAALELAEQGTRMPTPPVVSPMRPGRTRPSTTTMTSSSRWWRSSPSSTPTTA